MHGTQRRERSQCVTADVAGNKYLELAQYAEEPTMGAAGTEGRGTLGKAGNRLENRSHCLAGCRPDDVGADLATVGNPVLADIDPNTHGSNLLLKDAVHLLDDHETLDLVGKRPNHFFRERVDQAELEDGGVGIGLLDMLIGNAGGKDAEVAVTHFNPVKRGR